ncbi:MAG: hypothetical protein CVU42_00945 [Chloroflexi bacterium HGW-Chloroflexi-4]|jgi:hypothetical protein|nr:MAG: hypothetical protein CVU42_00945 [Chloroflexi bacterium HGW-Chloroflexi-4]
MKFDIRILNCLWLIIPLLVWNIILGPRIVDARITSDLNSPKWLLISENIVRIFVFVLPLLLPMQLKDASSKAGLWIYIIGTLIYFASWLPILLAPQSKWSNSIAGLLAPRLTPFLSFLGLAFIGLSWQYALFAAAFILLHTWHGVQNL